MVTIITFWIRKILMSNFVSIYADRNTPHTRTRCEASKQTMCVVHAHHLEPIAADQPTTYSKSSPEKKNWSSKSSYMKHQVLSRLRIVMLLIKACLPLIQFPSKVYYNRKLLNSCTSQTSLFQIFFIVSNYHSFPLDLSTFFEPF